MIRRRPNNTRRRQWCLSLYRLICPPPAVSRKSVIFPAVVASVGHNLFSQDVQFLALFVFSGVGNPPQLPSTPASQPRVSCPFLLFCKEIWWQRLLGECHKPGRNLCHTILWLMGTALFSRRGAAVVSGMGCCLVYTFFAYCCLPGNSTATHTSFQFSHVYHILWAIRIIMMIISICITKTQK